VEDVAEPSPPLESFGLTHSKRGIKLMRQKIINRKVYEKNK